jgi:hypothetical protein
MTETIWLKNPLILFKSEDILKVIPNNSMTIEEKINSVTRLIIYITIVAYFLSNSLNIVFAGLIALSGLVLYYNLLYSNKNKKNVKKIMKEGFTNPNLYNMLKDNYTNPNVKNPLMNILVNEIGDNPHKSMAAPAYNVAVEKEINNNTKNLIVNTFDDKNVKDKLFKNLGDNLEFENSMRQFYTNPITQTPNDQNGFASFCYGNLPSDKNIQVF